jgi:hypothetical protein
MTTIKLKNGSGAPTAGDLAQGEPALDLTNKRLYTEDSLGAVIEVGTNPGTDVTFADNRKAVFGAGSDLQIYHDGSNSFVEDTGTGALFAKTNGTGVFLYSGSEALATFNTNGASNLYYDNALKLSTTSTGIDVTGTVTADGLTVNSGVENLVATFQSTDTEAQIALVDTTGTSTIRARNDFRFHVNNAATPALKIDSNNDISFYEDTGTTAKLFWDASAESLGIGTSSPSSSLTTEADSGVLVTDASGLRQIEIVPPQTSNSFVGEMGTRSSHPLVFNTVNTERMRIDSSGNVGIGTSSPIVASGYANLTLNGNSGGQLHFTDNDVKKATIASSVDDLYVQSGAQTIFRNGGFASGNEAMRIDSSGNVGIGTSSPQNLLHINKSDSLASAMQFTNSTTGATSSDGVFVGLGSGEQGYFWNYEANDLILGTSNAERMRIDSGGHTSFTLGTDAMGTFLDAVGEIGSGNFALQVTNSAGSALKPLGFRAEDIRFATGSAERMRIDSSGNLLVGTTGTIDSGNSFKSGTPLGIYRTTGTAAGGVISWWSDNGSTQSLKGYTRADGGIANYSANDVNLSDERVKTNIAPLGSMWDKFKALEIVTFKYKDQTHDNDNIGVIAQQVESVAPEFVDNEGFGETPEGEEPLKAIFTADLYHATIRALQEAMNRIETLEAEVTALKGD